MVKSLVLHVGDSKTGTTFLQNVLFNRLYACRDKTIFYRWQSRNIRHQLGLTNVYSDDDIVKNWKSYANSFNADSSDIGVVSNESLASADPQRLKTVVHRLFDVDEKSIQVVCYLRPHCDALISRYAQHVKNGQFTASLTEYYSVIKNRLEYETQVKAWVDVFGDQFSVYAFDKSQLFNEDIAHDFFKRVIKSEDFILNDTTHLNQSPGLKELSVLNYYYTIMFGPVDKNKTRRIRNYPRPYVKLDELFRHSADMKGTSNKVRIHHSLWKKMLIDLGSDAQKIDKIASTGNTFTRALRESGKKAVPTEFSLDLQENFSVEDAEILKALLHFVKEKNAFLQDGGAETPKVGEESPTEVTED